MKISGFSFIRNGELLGYPYVESIRSALPICDEFVIAVGNGEDETISKIKKIRDSKIKIIETEWNENQTRGGFVYAQQKMIAWYHCTGDWAFYLEGDEVLHEKDYSAITNAMNRYLDNSEVETLAFRYHHFYGNPQTVVDSPAVIRYAPRIIRNNIRAIAMDGLHFTVMENPKKGRWPRGKKIDAGIYHYGYVRSIDKMREKMRKASKYWSSNANFNAYGDIDPHSLKRFDGTHPSLMKHWLDKEAQKEFTLNNGHKLSSREKRHRLMMRLEKILRADFSKKHWRAI